MITIPPIATTMNSGLMLVLNLLVKRTRKSWKTSVLFQTLQTMALFPIVLGVAKMSEIVVLMEASKIPNGSTITKKTGEYLYVLKKDITVYYDVSEQPRKPLTIKSEDGMVFLMNKQGDLSCIKGSTKLLWYVESRDLMRYLEKQEEETYQ